MVALLVTLRWRQLGHQLAKNPWMIVAYVVTGLTAAGLLSLLSLGLAVLRIDAPELALSVLVIATSVIVAGWWIGAVLTSNDESLAPERFALLPVRATQIMPGLVAAGIAGVGGIASLIALLLMLIGWSVSPAALLGALVMVPATLVVCVLGGRVVSGLLARWLAKRRVRDIVAIIGVLLGMMSGLLLNLVITALANAESLDADVAAFADILAWTPIGASAGAAEALGRGAVLVAALRLLVVLGTIVVLWLIATRVLEARLVTPVQSAGGGKVRSGTLIDRIFPATASGAVAARTVRYRRRDPRHIMNLVAVLVLPAAMVGAVLFQTLNSDSGEVISVVVLMPAIVSVLIGTILQMELAYDHQAIALHAYSGVRGVADRYGRLLGNGFLIVPLMLIVCGVCVGLTGQWALLPASLGAALGPSFVAAGVGSWIGAYLPGRAPAPDTNPLGRGSSGGLQSMLAMLVILPIMIVLGAPAFGFAVAALWNPPLGWASLGCALLIGAAAIIGGAHLGGRALDRRWPEVLKAVTSES